MKVVDRGYNLYFFIFRTIVNDVKVENNIGDAIVDRIIRAHQEKTPWRCCIMIPLLPGFTFPVDHADASAVCHWAASGETSYSAITAIYLCRSGLSSSVRTVPLLADQNLFFPDSGKRESMYASVIYDDSQLKSLF